MKIKAKKIPLYALSVLYAMGASATIAFGSFGGMFALVPILGLAIGAFGLSLLYEGEIYISNIKSALSKLFQYDYLQRTLAEKFLKENLLTILAEEDCPLFFEAYRDQLFLENDAKRDYKKGKKDLKKGKIDKAKLKVLKLAKKHHTKKLKEMEEMLSIALFSKKEKKDDLATWLEGYEKTESFRTSLTNRSIISKLALGFSAVAGVAMGLGTGFLILDSLSTLGLLTLISASSFYIPALIAGTTLVFLAGAAFCYLTYNSIMDLVVNETVQNWYASIKKEGLTTKSVLKFIATLIMFSAAITLSIFTAGMWASQGKEAARYAIFLGEKIVDILFKTVAGILFISSMAFNIENAKATFDLFLGYAENLKNPLIWIKEKLTGLIAKPSTENWLQFFNPFRLIIWLVLSPVRFLLFIAHIIAEAADEDRVGNLPPWIPATVDGIDHFLEESHIFVDHPTTKRKDDDHTAFLLNKRFDKEAGHDHSSDLPTRILKTLLIPVYGAAILWNRLASLLNKEPTSWEEAYKREVKEEHVHEEKDVPSRLDYSKAKDFEKSHVHYLIEKHQDIHLQNEQTNPQLINEKIVILDGLKKQVKGDQSLAAARQSLMQQDKDTLARHRNSLFSKGETKTVQFLDKLEGRLSLKDKEYRC